MISAKWMFLILIAWTILEYFLLSTCYAVYKAKEDQRRVEQVHLKRQVRLDAVEEYLELICEAASDNASVIDERSKGDYDIGINRKGEKEIREILRRIVSW